MHHIGPDAEFTKGFEITKLPNWEGIGRSKMTVKLPQSRDQLVKVVLHKAADKWSDLSHLEQDHSPIIVKRNPKTIKAISTSDLKRSRELEDIGGSQERGKYRLT